MKIIFQSRDELCYFKQLIFSSDFKIKEIKKNQYGYQLIISSIPLTILIEYFIKIYEVFRLRQKIEEIACITYLYSDNTEVEQVFEWTNYLLYDKTFMREHFASDTLFSHLQSILNRQFTFM